MLLEETNQYHIPTVLRESFENVENPKVFLDRIFKDLQVLSVKLYGASNNPKVFLRVSMLVDWDSVIVKVLWLIYFFQWTA